MTVRFTKEDFIKHLQLILILVILGLLLWSKPWDTSSAVAGDTRTIKVSGDSIIEATPDEFVFYPYFEEEGTDEEVLKTSLTAQTSEVVEAIKALGVAEDNISLDANSFDRWYWEEDEKGTLSANLTITVDNKDLAQEVQDYLLGTDAKGQLTPQGVFSKSKQKELDAQAIEEASKDARSKAEKQADLFGAKLGEVVSVEQGLDSVLPVIFDSAIDENIREDSAQSLPVLPGQNEYTQVVNVTYELK